MKAKEESIIGWVAVDKSGCAYLFNKKPMRFGSCWYEYQNNAGRNRLWTFNNITDLNWSDEPFKVKITITPIE